MQSVSLSFRRLYATTIPEPALIARTASTPSAVRLRRLRKRGPVAPGTSDANAEGLTPTEHARFQRLRAKGELGKVGKEMTEGEWLEELNNRRSRLRGVRPVKRADGTEELAVVGQRVWLPNIIFRLVRNNTPKGEPYNPYEATFRIPQSVTKTDIRSYLLAVYGVKTTYIRTDNYISPLHRTRAGLVTKSWKTYKRAVVGLVDPFYYPLRLEDMESGEKKKREEWIENKFGIEATKWTQKYELLRMTRTGSSGWKWRGPLVANRSQILKLVAERRAAREGLIASQVNEWKEMREKGERITIGKYVKKKAVDPTTERTGEEQSRSISPN